MSTKGTNAPLPGASESAADERAEAQPSKRVGEGLGVFRALILMSVFYVVLGMLGWLLWHLFRHWHSH